MWLWQFGLGIFSISIFLQVLICFCVIDVIKHVTAIPTYLTVMQLLMRSQSLPQAWWVTTTSWWRSMRCTRSDYKIKGVPDKMFLWRWPNPFFGTLGSCNSMYLLIANHETSISFWIVRLSICSDKMIILCF